MQVSIIIPHYRQEALLQICLAKLEAQTFPRDQFEIVVVENSDRPMSAEVQARFPRVRYLNETKPGSYAARNHGIRQTTSPILAFTDSDCLPEPDWLANAMRQFETQPDVDLIGGNIEIFFRQNGRPNPIELYDSTNYMQQEWYTTLGFAICANFFIKRTLFEKEGLFNESLHATGIHGTRLEGNNVCVNQLLPCEPCSHQAFRNKA